MAEVSSEFCLGNKTIQNVSKFGKSKLLIAETASINRRSVRQISWIDVKTGQTSALYSGFLRATSPNPVNLFMTTVSTCSSWQSPEIQAVKPFLPIGRTRCPRYSWGQLTWYCSKPMMKGYSYDVMTGELQTLDRLSEVCRLKHAVWIDDLEQLACKERLIPANRMIGAAVDFV